MSSRPLHERAGAAADAPQPGSARAEPLVVPAPEARRLLGNISARKFAQMVAAGEIPVVRIGRRIFFTPDSLRQVVKDRTEGGS